MTELNQSPDTVAGTKARWPQAPDVQRATDQDVDKVLDVLSKLPDMQVAEHATVYGELHDSLLEALNAELPSVADDAHR
jgi:hypothetical protein